MPEEASDIIDRLLREADANGAVIGHFLYSDEYGWVVEGFRLGSEGGLNDEGVMSTTGVAGRLSDGLTNDLASVAPLIVAAALSGRSGRWGVSGEIVIRPGEDIEVGMMDADESEESPDDPEDYVETDLGSFRVRPDLISGDVERPEDQASLDI